MQRQSNIGVPKEKISSFCRRNHIQRLLFFGSVLRHYFTPESDIDVLVEFEPGHTPGLRFLSIEKDLAEILGRKVDLHTRNGLSPYLRDAVLAEAEEQYVKA